MRIILTGLCAVLIFLSLTHTQDPLYFWLCVAGLTIISIVISGKFFSFFLTTFILAYSYTDLGSDSAFYSLFLPLYTWIALIILMITLFLNFPEFLGQKSNRPEGSFWDGFGGDGGGDS